MKSRFKEVCISADCLKIDLNKVIGAVAGEVKIAYILHDKNASLSHYHIFLDYGKNSVENNSVTKLLKVSDKFVLSSRVKNWRDIKNYLIHTRDYEYSLADIVANFDLSTY